MAQNFKIDQQGTFVAPPLFLQCQPKKRFGSDAQEVDKATGAPKWEVHVVGMFHGFGGVPAPEVMKVGIAGPDPSQGLRPNVPVILQGLEVGVMAKTVKDKTTGEERQVGVTVWYRAESMHSAAEAPASKAA